MQKYDLVVKNGILVIPRVGVIKADVAASNGRIAAIAEDIPAPNSSRVIDAAGRHVFPGAIDSHFHIGIYRPMMDDAVTESGSAASGGVTTILSYFRTGKNYLNKMGPYKEIFPEVLEVSKGSFVTDYSYHLAIMTRTQLSEMEWLVGDAGVSQFKYYMFYKTLDLAGSSRGDSYLMVEEPLDLGFLYELMSEGVAKGRITLTQMVKLVAENPAKIMGLYPRKGTIRVGSDADLVLIDPDVKWTIKASEQHARAGYSCYEGMQVTGKPVLSLLRGQVLLKDGKLQQSPGFGRFIPAGFSI